MEVTNANEEKRRTGKTSARTHTSPDSLVVENAPTLRKPPAKDFEIAEENGVKFLRGASSNTESSVHYHGQLLFEQIREARNFCIRQNENTPTIAVVKKHFSEVDLWCTDAQVEEIILKNERNTLARAEAVDIIHKLLEHSGYKHGSIERWLSGPTKNIGAR